MKQVAQRIGGKGDGEENLRDQSQFLELVVDKAQSPLANLRALNTFMGRQT